MLPLKLFRGREKGFSDLLNYAALVDEGIVLCKDGSLLAGWFYRGSDIASSTDGELNYVSARANAALSRLGSGWVTWVDAVRMESSIYPSRASSTFPDAISQMIDEERRRDFEAAGMHYESEYALIVQYQPPYRRKSKLGDLVYDDYGRTRKENPGTRILQGFKRALSELQDTLTASVRLSRMVGFTFIDPDGTEHLQDELLNYLHYCITGQVEGINVPPVPMYLDAYLGMMPFWTGDTPRIGDQYISVVGIDGFPAESWPGILDVLDQLPVEYRWSTRFIYMDQHEALGELKKYRRQWEQQVRGFWSQIFATKGGPINEDALLMKRQAEDAMSDAHSALVTFGYLTTVLVLMGPERDVVIENAREMTREIRRRGFASRIEDVNSMEAFLGSLPGHAAPNVRRPVMHTLQMADMLPLASVWAGLPHNPCPFFPENSPPLLMGATTGSTPFRFNVHVGDVGHTLVFGPTGNGKSTLLAVMAAQFRRYPRARVMVFDFGLSMMPYCEAAGGDHYDLGDDQGQAPGLCPLQYLETDPDAAWAEDWLATCYELQVGAPPSPIQRERIHRALALMRESSEGRSLTDFCAAVQDTDIRAALAPYTISGALGGMLDARSDSLADSPFTVFETQELMALGDKNVIPVLLYLFRRLQRSLKGEPTLLILDEGWVMLGHPVFREKLREWLKTMRRANCSVVLATQQLSDAVRSGLLDVLMEAAPTKLLLPNHDADKRGTRDVLGPRDLYELFGLNETQIALLKSATPKRDYYYVSPEGRRMFELQLGPLTLSFCAVNDKDQLRRIRELKLMHGAKWPYVWLDQRGVEYESLLEAA